jgi:hypothetical protein
MDVCKPLILREKFRTEGPDTHGDTVSPCVSPNVNGQELRAVAIVRYIVDRAPLQAGGVCRTLDGRYSVLMTSPGLGE